MIKPQDSLLALVDMAIEGFISKTFLEGTQAVELPTFKDPEPVELPILENLQPIIEKITSSEKGEETKSEDITLEEDTENPI